LQSSFNTEQAINDQYAVTVKRQESLALAIMARDDSPATSTAAASSTAPASNMAATAARRPMRGKVGSEFKT